MSRLSYFFYMLRNWAFNRMNPEVPARRDSFLERFRGPELKEMSGCKKK